MSFDFSTLITDRAAADLENLRALLSTPMEDWTAEQLAQFNRAISKGAYNYTDLNRVTQCMEYLDETLRSYGYETGYQRISIPHQPLPSKLPEGYTELEYIQSSGNQYINTGAIVRSTSGFQVKFSLVSASGISGIIGGFTYGGYNNNFAAYEGQWMTQYGNNASYQFGATDTAIHEIKQNIISGEVSFDEKIVQSGLAYYDNTQRTFNLFCYNGGPNYPTFWISSTKIYSCKIYDNGTLIRNFIPCHDSTGNVGLYDTVNAQFYGNAGTGAFIAGPEIAPEPDPSLDPYTWYEDDVPTAPQMAQYLNNVLSIWSTIMGDPTLPETMVNLTQEGANQIEAALIEINTAIEQIIAAMARSNSFTFWSGNRPFPTAYSNPGRNWAELDAMGTGWRNWQVATWYLLLYGNLEAEGDVT